jgi:large subunit GTPase 1
MRSGQGNPDEARAARYILKDYVDGELLYCHPPPGVSESEFNRPTNEKAALRLIGKKRAPITRVGKNSDTFVPTSNMHSVSTGLKETRSDAVDDAFFDSDSTSRLSRPLVQQSGKEFSRSMLYPHQNSVAADGTPIDPRQARLLALLNNIDKDKKHKKMKRVKQRSGKGYV